MPKGNRKGPMGQGPMTGRGLGFCQGDDTPGYMNNYGRGGGMGRWHGGGMGRGRGFGRGQGFRGGNVFGSFFGGAQMLSKKDEARMLKSQAEDIKSSLLDIEKRIKDLEH